VTAAEPAERTRHTTEADAGVQAPLTERILRWLPGPAPVWIVIWALGAPLRPIVLFAVLGLQGETLRSVSRGELFVTQSVFGYIVLLLLWGTSRLVGDVRRLAPTLARIGAPPPDRAFPQLSGVVGPVALTLLVLALSTATSLVKYGPTVAIVDIPLLIVVTLPIMTFVWAYLMLLAGLNRLGAASLSLGPFPEDRSLGLGRLGAAAFAGLSLVFAAAVPALLVTGRDQTTFVLVVVIVLVTVLLFVLSQVQLHGQMSTAKRRIVAQTTALVSEAYAPVRAETTLATLQQQAAALGAAQSLADRADRILVWPVDERMVAFITVVVTGVVTSLLVRLALIPFGA
jgi:hypothetical protein